MKRITPQVKAIADAHIQAELTGKFDDPKASTKEEVIALMKEGKTFSKVMEQIVIGFVPTTSIMIVKLWGNGDPNVISRYYRQGVYNGFKKLFS